jgi:L-ascorbate metabolism protein UlaG (beta-lactamase superfamily)
MTRCSTILLALCALACAGCGGLATPNGDLFPPPPRDAVTFWGHACVYIDAGGVGVVTDPVFERSVFMRKRRIASPPPSSYAGARVVLISHAHPDHLSGETLRTFPEGVVILAPRPCAKYLDDVGREVRIMAPGDVFETEGVRVTAVAAHHMGPRLGLDAAADGRALGYVVETAAATIFYSGDTDYFSGFADVGWSFDPDVAILNINGHLASTEATRAAWATRAPVVIPIHWGGFGYWVFGGNKRPRDGDTLARVIGEKLKVLEVGQSLPLVRPNVGASEPTAR